MLEPWGKLDRKASDVASATRLTLVAHCIDVAAVMEALLALPTQQARLAALAGRELTPLDRQRLVALSFLHDPGKAGAGFYSRGLPAEARLAWQHDTHTQWNRNQMGHIGVVAPLFHGDHTYAALQEALGVETVRAWGGMRSSQQQRMDDLWLASISHHGQPVTTRSLSRDAGNRWPTWTHPIAGYEPLAGLRQVGDAARHLFADAFESQQIMEPFADGLVHAFAGLVALADWIGSNTDEGFFAYDIGPQTMTRWPIARTRARDVLRRMRIDVEELRADLASRAPTFEQVFGVAPRDTQLMAARQGEGRVVALEAETGSGKTEAALWRFKTLFEAGEVDALCFLLPTRVAATGIYQRVHRCMEALFPDAGMRPSTVLAVPGYLRANGKDAEGRLAGFDVLWPDDEAAGNRPLYWAAENSKRYFAGSAVAGTIDQFLLSALQVKHSHMRAALALRALIVVDEVHASDAYMTTLLHEALGRHVKAGGHALLMSATLTGQARAKLLTAGAPRQQALARRAVLSAPDAPYPCVASLDAVQPCKGADRRKLVRVQLKGAMRDPGAVARLALDAVAQGARVLVLRNTVRQALATQQAIEAKLGTTHPALFNVNGVVALHHGRYAFEDRRVLDARVEALFGTGAARDTAPRLLVGTQTLEISVDCDADLMITDIVPIDVLLQRLGRLHRHAQRDPSRAAAVAQPRVVVLTPTERDMTPLLAGSAARGLGIGPRSAYENLLSIEATWRLLDAVGERPCEIPAENRRLVEAGAGGAALSELAATLGGAWLDHHASMFGKRSAQATQAVPLLVSWHKSWGEGGWSELGDEVRTRLGLDSVDVALAEPWITPLGNRIARLAVPAWMLSKSSGLPEVGAQRHARGQLQFRVGDVELIYDRMGLRMA